MWAYIFGAICPKKGKGAGLVLPYCDTEAMQDHLAEISQAVDDGAHAVLILDQAGWHVTPKLKVPDNITLMFLPPRSPELNTVVNAGVNSGQRAEQNQASCGARMRPPGGRSPSGVSCVRVDFERVSASLSGAALGQTIAVAVHLENVDMVGNAVEQCAGQTFGSQGFGPFVKRKIAGDQGRAAFVSL